VDAVGHGQFVDHSQVEIAKPSQFRAHLFAAMRGDATGRFPACNENDRETQASKLIGTAGKQCLCVILDIPGVGVDQDYSGCGAGHGLLLVTWAPGRARRVDSRPGGVTSIPGDTGLKGLKSADKTGKVLAVKLVFEAD
jgi:hypothetical protein